MSALKDGRYRSLIKQMIYTMRRVGGVGIAAPQVGKSIRLAVMEMGPSKSRPDIEKKGPIAIINPRVLKYSSAKEGDWEGCLSLKRVRGNVPRPKSITVEYYNERGEKVIEKASGLWARIFQHEIDHLNGITYVDRMADMTTLMTVEEFKKQVSNKK
jgi:peptide deformylase